MTANCFSWKCIGSESGIEVFGERAKAPCPTDFPHDLFLSHSTKAKAVVRPLAERLRQDGLTVWFDEWECPSPAGAGEGGRRPGEGRGEQDTHLRAGLGEG